MKPSTLADDINDALDGELEKCDLNRKALLQLYATWQDDDPEVVRLDSKSSSSTKRRDPKRLGSPATLGSMPSEDPLPALGQRLVKAGGSSASLARVSRATFAFGHLLVSYEQGMCAGMSIQDWRKMVEDHFAKAEASILGARAHLAQWVKGAAANRPNSAVLKDQNLISPEMIQDLLCVDIDAARKIISDGRYGKFVKVGRRQFLLRADFDAALLAQQAARSSSAVKPSTGVLANLPRKPRGKGRGRSAGPETVADSSSPPPPPPSSTPPSASGPSSKQKRVR